MQNATHKLHSEHNENGELQLTISIPVKKDQEADGLTIAQVRAISCDILGSFSKRIIASLERRMSACMEKLMNHFDTAFTYPYGGQIFYRAKNNRLEAFNLPTYEGMEECIEALKHSRFAEVLDNSMWVDQILKALLNDPEQDHSDAGCFKYSQLVSLLMECHLYHE